MTREKVNSEGLTWLEWACAAKVPPIISTGGFLPGFTELYGPPDLFRVWRKRWLAGEDPAEWRAQ